MPPRTPGAFEIELASGRYLNLLDPDPADICVEDVAHGLAHICRFGGHCREPYYVAEHAILVSSRLKQQGAPVDVQLAGLHHDDAEAFVGDNPSPLKELIPGLVQVEHKVFEAVRQALNLESLPFDDPRVKEADTWALSAEAYHLLPSQGSWCAGGYDPKDPGYSRFWGFLPPRDASYLWLKRHERLTEALKDSA